MVTKRWNELQTTKFPTPESNQQQVHPPPHPPPPLQKKTTTPKSNHFFSGSDLPGVPLFFKRVRRFLNKNFRVCFVFHNFFGGVGWTVQLRIDHHLQVGVAMGCLDTVAMELLARCDHIYSDGCAEIAADQARLAGLVGLAKLRLRCRWESLFFFCRTIRGEFFFWEEKVLPSAKG